ncbi:Uncharacterised protein [uncultured archaeon]|nr:Uncharacterised protein [uncultured archaeon]
MTTYKSEKLLETIKETKIKPVMRSAPRMVYNYK